MYPKSLLHEVGNDRFRCLLRCCGPHRPKSMVLVSFRTAPSEGILFLKEGIMASLLLARRVACSSQKNFCLLIPGKPPRNTLKTRGLWSESSSIEGSGCFWCFPSVCQRDYHHCCHFITPSTDEQFSRRKGVGGTESHSAQGWWPLRTRKERHSAGVGLKGKESHKK